MSEQSYFFVIYLNPWCKYFYNRISWKSILILVNKKLETLENT